MQQLFSKIQDELISRIEQSKESLKIAVTWFTNHDLFDAVLKKMDNPAFKVALVVLNDRINNKKEGVDFQQLIKKKGSFYYSSVENMVHHKFCIIDDKVVITGSYNWTYYAENRNWEIIVIIEDPLVVLAYIKEFDKIKRQHERVKNVAEKRRFDTELSYSEYLQTDSILQAQKEERKGNNVQAAKVYTEILRTNKEHVAVQKARAAIVNKIVEKKFEVCPFEIGIEFQTGYLMAIPAFAKLSISVSMGGCTTIENQKTVRITIQKYDYSYQTILQFSLDNIQPSPAGTLKIEHTLTVDTHGILTVFVKEVNGFGRTKTEKVDLRKFI